MMKKLVAAAIIDSLLIITMIILMIWENHRRLFGLAALSGMGRFVVYRMILGAAVLLLAVLLALIIYKKWKG